MFSVCPDQASSYLVTKHSWKGKYRRVLTLSQDAFSTFNPGSMETTNTWKITDVVGLTPAPTSAGGPAQTPGAALEFQLVFRKGKKTDSMRFSSEWRSTIITEALRLIQKSGHEPMSAKVYTNHLNTRQVRYLNGPNMSGSHVVQFSNGGLEARQKMSLLWSEMFRYSKNPLA